MSQTNGEGEMSKVLKTFIVLTFLFSVLNFLATISLSNKTTQNSRPTLDEIYNRTHSNGPTSF